MVATYMILFPREGSCVGKTWVWGWIHPSTCEHLARAVCREGSPGTAVPLSGQLGGRLGTVGIPGDGPGLLVSSGLICKGQLPGSGPRQRSQMGPRLFN